MNKYFLSILLFPFGAIGQYLGTATTKIKAPLAITGKAQAFDLADVKLLNSRFKDNMDREAKWLLALPVERLMHSFKVNAGMLTTKKNSLTKMPEPLGGWEALDMGLRGHSIGHYLSGVSLQYAATGNIVFKKKLDSLIAQLAIVQQTLNQDGYLSAFPQQYIDRNIQGTSVWAPWYTLHKLFAGFIDAYTYGDNDQALDIVSKMANWAYTKVNSLSDAVRAKMLRNEFGGMNDAFYNLYAITANPQHLKLAQLFYHHAALNPLVNQTDSLNPLHANTIIPKVVGEARAYELTGDIKNRTTATFFWNTVIKNHTYAHGGNSDKEHFFEPGKIAEHLSGNTGETCNTYNMLKLTRHLFTWTADCKYADYYEQALYNHILGQQDPQSGMVCYFTPMKSGAYRLYSTFDKSFWCCVGSGFESHSKYNEAIYYHTADSLFVNLYIPSELNWKEKGLQLKQETLYPEESNVRFSITAADSNSPLTLLFRYPAWAVNGIKILVNGKQTSIKQMPGSYVAIKGKWKVNDEIKIELPMSFRLMPTPDNPQKAAIAYGPVLMAGLAGQDSMLPPAPFHDPVDPYQYYGYNYHIPSNIPHTINLKGQLIKDCIKPAAGKLTFNMEVDKYTKPSISLVPYYEAHRQRYVVYWDVLYK